MKKILVSGGCGFIGSNLSVYLKKEFFDVYSLDNLSRSGSELNLNRIKNYKIKNYNIDICDTKKILKLPKFDFIIDCSALVEAKVSKDNIKEVLSVNFMGTNNILMKAVKDNSKIIFLSTSRVYSIKKIYEILKNKKNLNKKLFIDKKYIVNENFDKNPPITFYGLSKKFSEDLIKEYSYSFNIKYLINRFGVVSGPWQFGKVEQGFMSLWMWNHLRKKKLSFQGFGGRGFQVRDVLHVDDLCKLIIMQINKFNLINNEIFNVGGGLKNAIDLDSLTKICQRITGNKIFIGKRSKTEISDIPIYITDNKKISKSYNWKPTKTLFQIAFDIYNWQKKHYYLLKKFMK